MPPDDDWTHETLLIYFNRIVSEMDLRYQQRYDASQRALDAALLSADRAVQAALQAAKEAVIKAELSADKRFESVNEFREALGDQASHFLTRIEYSTAHDALTKRIDDVSARQDRSEGKSSGLNAGWGYTATAIGMVVALATLIGLVIAFKG